MRAWRKAEIAPGHALRPEGNARALGRGSQQGVIISGTKR